MALNLSSPDNGGNGNGTTKWATWISALAALALVIGGFATWISNQDNQISTLKSSQTALTRDLREVETQFCAADIIRNLMHNDDRRQIATMWEKVFGTRMPNDGSYNPTICNRSDN
ncbi:MAG: hypothetical protein KGL39_04050 [Patescibacteria group bacterium]|nr:hypothetical protein [Patescibacteria group bacterium]